MNGKNIAILRKKREINQEELARLLSINVATLSRWENGHFEPKASTINKLCEILHCTETELLNDSVSEKLSVGDKSMAVTVSGSYEIWEDETKFEEQIIGGLRKKRCAGLKLHKEAF